MNQVSDHHNGGTRRSWLIDLTPLRVSAAYRRLWWGQLLSGIGSSMTAVVVSVQVYQLTESSFAVGMVGFCALTPLLAVGLLGGAIIDSVDRRRLAFLTGLILVAVSLGFVAQAVIAPTQLWLLYALIVVQNAFFALESPTLRAIVPALMATDKLAAAAALSMFSFQISILLGPILAGFVIDRLGLGVAYLIDAITFAIAAYAAWRLPHLPSATDGTQPSFAGVIDGIRFLKSKSLLLMPLLLDINGMLFGMPRALFPALAATHFTGGAASVGLLYAAPAMGGIIGAFVSGPLTRSRRHGLALLIATVIWGLASALFAVSDILWIGIFFLALAGAADMATGVFRATILQTQAPGALMGRISAAAFVVGVGGPWLGDIESGIAAELTTPVFAAVLGGIACVVGVVMLHFWRPDFARYDASMAARAQG
ncbi:MFS transporter [Dongia rigui]|uniref:MFS transporter n=1 Tax=Dongia rigui TaxID=940149 RepID=A0ABU5E545_9PROT|nr:MFS transporter [Dongia rigui]MDY0874006.1 MFS transporter [Dongia rigui]